MKDETTASLQIVEVEGVRGYVDALGTVWLNAEDVARGLGFVQVKKDRVIKSCDTSINSENKYYTAVRWNRVNRYLKEFDFPPVDNGDYIPAKIFYLLAFKAKNAVAKCFQQIVATKILPQISQTILLKKILANPTMLAEILGIKDFEPDKKCAYVLQMDNGTVKIGVTQDFDRRIKEIMNGSGMEVIKHFHTNQMNRMDAFNVESRCHKTFADERKRGEFFSIDFDNACTEVKKALE